MRQQNIRARDIKFRSTQRIQNRNLEKALIDIYDRKASQTSTDRSFSEISASVAAVSASLVQASTDIDALESSVADLESAIDDINTALDDLASSLAALAPTYGTFTAALTPSAGTISLSQDKLSYSKHGKLVTVNGELKISSASLQTGSVTLSGLPYTNGNRAQQSSKVVFYGPTEDLSGLATGLVQGLLLPAEDTILLQLSNNFVLSDLAALLQTDTAISICFSYITD